MKTINIFLVAAFFVSAFACNTNMDNVLSSTDIAALQGMEAAYNGAVDANNSLATYVETTGITNDETCFNLDSMFHQNDSLFEANHMMYSHNNSGDDHDGNSWMMDSSWMNGAGGMSGNNSMMGSNSGMNGHGFNTSNCTASNLNLMDSLMGAHEKYHPED